MLAIFLEGKKVDKGVTNQRNIETGPKSGPSRGSFKTTGKSQ